MLRRRVLALSPLVLASLTRRSMAQVPRADRLADLHWAARHEAILRAVRQHRYGLLMLGDSITQELQRDGSADPRQNILPVWRRYFAPRDALNLGFAGDGSAHLLWRIEHGEVDGQSPRLVTLLIGANDAAPPWRWSPAQTVAGIDAIVAALRARLPASPIVVIGLLPSDFGDARLTGVNDLLRQQRWPTGVRFVDVGGVLRRPDGQIDRTLYLDPLLMPPHPALHPNRRGWDLLAGALEPVMAALFGKTLRQIP